MPNIVPNTTSNVLSFHYVFEDKIKRRTQGRLDRPAIDRNLFNQSNHDLERMMKEGLEAYNQVRFQTTEELIQSLSKRNFE